MKNANRTLLVVSSCALLLFVLAAPAQNWPQWLGANRDGKAAFTPPQTWPKELSPKWKVTVGEGVATPALVGDKLYVFARQDGGEIIRCLDAATGKEFWQDKYDVLPANGPAQSFSGPRASPAVAEGKVVTLGLRGTLTCYDAASGKQLWRKDDYRDSFPRFFTASSPLITGGLCIAQLGGGDNGGVIAYELATGAEKWKWTGGGAAYASATLMTVASTKMVVAETDKQIVGLDVTDGQLRWKIPFVVQGRGYNASTPIVDGDILMYAGSGRGVTAVKIAKDGDTLTAKELWQNRDNSVQFSTPVLMGDALYGLTDKNDFFCVNAKDGKTAWTAPAVTSGAGGVSGGRQRGGGGFGQIIDAGPILLALTPASELIAFQPSEKSFVELARIKVASTPTYACPVVSGNRIFIKDQNDVMLYAVQ